MKMRFGCLVLVLGEDEVLGRAAEARTCVLGCLLEPSRGFKAAAIPVVAELTYRIVCCQMSMTSRS